MPFYCFKSPLLSKIYDGETAPVQRKEKADTEQGGSTEAS